MNIIAVRLLLAIGVLSYTATAAADEPLDLSMPDEPSGHHFDFDSAAIGNIERRRLTGNIRVRGWEVRENFYIGQARVGDKWGLGMVFQQGKTVYGLNHRGLEVTYSFKAHAPQRNRGHLAEPKPAA